MMTEPTAPTFRDAVLAILERKWVGQLPYEDPWTYRAEIADEIVAAAAEAIEIRGGSK